MSFMSAPHEASRRNEETFDEVAALACVTSLCLAGCGSLGPGSTAQTITLDGAPNGVAVRVVRTARSCHRRCGSGSSCRVTRHISHLTRDSRCRRPRNSLSQIAIRRGRRSLCRALWFRLGECDFPRRCVRSRFACQRIRILSAGAWVGRAERTECCRAGS